MRRRTGWPLASIAALMCLGPLARGDALPRPTLAIEDTIRTIDEPLPEVLVEAERATLDEILRRVAEGEARRDSLMQDAAYTLCVKVVARDRLDDPPEKTKRLLEDVIRVYEKRPNRVRRIPLKHYAAPKKPKEGEGEEAEEDQSIEVSTGGGNMSEQFIGFAFDPRARSAFKFEIEERSLVGGHVIYQISFTPRSKLDPLPTGRCWVDTNEFVILREEFWYRDRSPAPLFIKSIDSCVLERTRADHVWVLSRVLARAELSGPVRFAGKVGREELHRYYDISVLQTDWIVNGGVPDSLFEPTVAP